LSAGRKMFLLLVAFAAAQDTIVRLNVMAGTEDIQWHVKGVRNGLPCEAVARPLPWYRMGYRGFEITSGGSTSCVYDNYAVEMALLQSGQNVLPESVVTHVQSEIKRLQQTSEKQKQAWALEHPDFSQVGVKANCTVPVRGPDNETVYDPTHQVCGYWVTYQGENNCYDYGNNIATNTFAQPGRGSGQKWKANTCDDMRAAAERDGLKWAGTTLPTSEPSDGHYAALLIWPDTNFHWIRFDSKPAGFWSHKPGGTPVRNVDNNNKPIKDPSKSDFSPWTQFCGYMTTVPSIVTIN